MDPLDAAAIARSCVALVSVSASTSGSANAWSDADIAASRGLSAALRGSTASATMASPVPSELLFERSSGSSVVRYQKPAPIRIVSTAPAIRLGHGEAVARLESVDGAGRVLLSNAASRYTSRSEERAGHVSMWISWSAVRGGVCGSRYRAITCRAFLGGVGASSRVGATMTRSAPSRFASGLCS